MINLHTLTLTSTQYNQLKYGQGHAGPPTFVLVFQFVFKSNTTESFLTLKAYPMQHGHVKIDNGVPEILSSDLTSPILTLSDGQILGDQQVYISTNDPKNPGMDQVMTDPGFKHFVFTSRIDGDRIYYVVTASDGVELTGTSATLNPSPPFSAY